MKVKTKSFEGLFGFDDVNLSRPVHNNLLRAGHKTYFFNLWLKIAAWEKSLFKDPNEQRKNWEKFPPNVEVRILNYGPKSHFR